LGSFFFIELVASCFSFPTRLILPEMGSITLDIVKNLRRGRTVTFRYQDSNSWIVTVQCFLMSNFDYLRGKTEFFFLIELVASCLSFPTRPILPEMEFYNSRYS